MTSRWQRWTLAIVVGFVIAGIAVVGRESSLARRSADFTISYAAALLIREGRPEAVYQRDQLGPLMLRLSDNAIDPRLPFDAPLAIALVLTAAFPLVLLLLGFYLPAERRRLRRLLPILGR